MTLTVIGPHLLFLGDCLDILPTIGMVDCVVTDPAYPTISGGTPDDASRPSGILADNDGKIFAENDTPVSAWLPVVAAAMRDPAHAYLMTNFYNLETMLSECRRAGLGIHNLLVWRKNNATPNRWYMKDVEYTVFARRGPAFPINDCGSKTCFEAPSVRDRAHPTQKPVELMQGYIENSTQPSGVVLDPFMGVATTGVACHQSGRRFIGIEKDPSYYWLAVERMRGLLL